MRRPHRESLRLLAEALALVGGVRAEFLGAARDAAPAQRGMAGAAGVTGKLATAFLLPPDLPDFTGRGQVVARLGDLLAGGGDGAAGSPAVVVAGRAGVGKTALAVHVAQQLRRRFPDGQLYVDLRGLQAQALDPAAVLGGFLRALGSTGPRSPKTSMSAPACTVRCWPIVVSSSCWTMLPMRRRSAHCCPPARGMPC